MKSGKEVAKVSKRYPKSDERYWKERVFKPTYVQNGERHEVKLYTARIQHQGRRETFTLNTANREEAGKAARDIYLQIVANGWEEVVAQRKKVAVSVITIGDFLEEAKKVSDFSPRTFADYAMALRRIAADIAGIKDPNNDRYSHMDGRRDAWLAKVHKIPLKNLTPAAVQAWRLTYLETRRSNPERERRAKTTCNTRIKSARALFSERRVIRHMAKSNQIQNPFQEVEFYPPARRRYTSKFQAERLLELAQEELMRPRGVAEKQKAYHLRTEAFKALIVFAFTGLRRKELDVLLWNQVSLADGFIDLRHTEFFKPKAESSVGRVPLDEQAVMILRGFRARSPQDQFVLSGVAAKTGLTYSHYRAAATFNYLMAWLRAYELPDGTTPFLGIQKPLHELRKEVGAVLTSRHGIFSAQLMLRHADIGTTSDYYADQKNELSLGIKLPKPTG